MSRLARFHALCRIFMPLALPPATMPRLNRSLLERQDSRLDRESLVFALTLVNTM